MKREVSLAVKILLLTMFLNSSLPLLAQNCNVDFPGVVTRTFSGSCGGTSTGNLELGINNNFSDGDVFIFDVPLVTINGNLHVDVEGNGKIIIPAGVTVDVKGKFDLHIKNGGCTSANPCTFNIEVNGNAIFGDDFKNDAFTIVWSGTGTVTFDEKIKNSNDACMTCGPAGCPQFQADPAECRDDGNCPDSDFCEKIIACTSDVTPPVISGCPANRTVNVAASGCNSQPVSWVPPSANDNCALSSFTSSHAPGAAFPKGTTTVTYTATDAAGNIATCSFDVHVVDNTAPVISGCPADITVNANASCQAVVNWTAPTFTDNCAGGTITTTKAPGSIFNKGTTTVTYTATDAGGNIATCSFDVNVVDNTAPVISGCPADITVNANASCQAVVNWTAPTFTDNCAGGTITTTRATGSIFNKGTTTVTYTATDAAGNIATCSFDVNVVDNTAPIITGCPANIMVNANASCQAVVNWIPPAAVDNCSVASLTSTHQPGDVFPLGITLVTYTASNSEGISSICTFNVHVKDSAAPVIEGPADIVSELENACTKRVNFSLPIIKDCSTVDVTSSHQSGDEFPLGTTEVTFTATDIHGNASTYRFNVTVEDKTSPVFQNCPDDVVVGINETCSAIVNWEIPTATDACGNVVVSSSHHPGTSFPPGNTTVTYTAVDSYGNISTCKFDIIVESEMPTILNCPADILLEAGEDNTVQADWILPTASAQCGEVTLTGSHQPGEIFNVGKTTVTYQATDHTGKTSYCHFNVIVSLPKIDIGISKVITPDGDGINDSWILDNIENFKDNQVVVFDRWGSVIYTATGYNNDNVVWQGRNRKGDLVPTGTYYYTISVNFSTEHSRRTGFIELIR